MEDHISIPRDYFDTLVRRVGLHDDADSIALSSSEYKSLLQDAREYKCLRTALTQGGVSSETLEILVNTPLPPTPPEECCEPQPSSPGRPKWSAQATVFVPKRHASLNPVQAFKREPLSENQFNISHAPPTPTSVTNEDVHEPKVLETEEVFEAYEEEEEVYENNHDDRSLVLRGLSPLTTIADVTKVVRGGQLLNIFLRLRYRSAHITFVEPVDAEKFLMYSKRSDIYIKGKRIEVFWDERQHFMPGHIARRIYKNGATRNLVVRFIKPDITEESIRDDLEHIHRLECASIKFENDHVFISTNGVSLAITAKACMSSRLKYKGTRIEHYVDECDQPLHPIVSKNHNKKTSPTKAATISHMNRFALLLEGDEDEFQEANVAAIRRNVSAGGDLMA